MHRELKDAVVVITGASSGIGLCAAAKFARRGSRLVLAARGEPALREAASECESHGAEALAVPTDVRDQGAVDALADAAVERFGRIDVWVNNAGVLAYGRFEQVPAEPFRAVIETNLMGQVHGCRAALRQFRRQGEGGLINLASVWGRVTTPDVSAYVTSKFAVRAFSECLRQELADTPRITVTTMLPQAVDTPIFGNAANYDGRRPRPIPPLLDPDEVAHAILRYAQDPAREITYRWTGRGIELLHSVAPRLYERIVSPAFAAGNYSQLDAREGAGNLLEPYEDYQVRGGWRDGQRRELRRALADAARGGMRGLLGRGPTG
jgi:NAD(P)-dependent dehydrogenase (short-subunit alcohol dehydrogenase family)